MNRIRTTLIFAGAALLAGCGSSDSRLSVLMKDAPSTSLTQAWVTVSDIYLVGSGGNVPLGSPNLTVDLLTLAHDTATLVQDAVVPPGTYTELRFVVTGGCIEVAPNTFYAASPNEHMPAGCSAGAGALRMPSFAQSGLKVTMAGDALNVQAGSKVLVVDFDVAQSFGLDAGNSGAWVMHPVITGGDITMSGNVTATIALASGYSLPAGLSLGTCTVTLSVPPTAADPQPAPTATASVSTGVGVAILYPPAGSYDAALSCSGAAITSTLTPAGTVTVGPGQAYPVTFTITSAGPAQ